MVDEHTQYTTLLDKLVRMQSRWQEHRERTRTNLANTPPEQRGRIAYLRVMHKMQSRVLADLDYMVARNRKDIAARWGEENDPAQTSRAGGPKS